VHLVTQLIDVRLLDEALYLASRIVLLEDGRVVTNVAAEDFLHSGLPEVKAYVRAFHRGQKALL